MEQNRKKTVFGIMGGVVVVTIAGGLLFGLTGILRDPAVPTEQEQKVQALSQPAPPTSGPSLSPSDGGTAEVAATREPEQEPFPQFDDEPHGS